MKQTRLEYICSLINFMNLNLTTGELTRRIASAAPYLGEYLDNKRATFPNLVLYFLQAWQQKDDIVQTHWLIDLQTAAPGGDRWVWIKLEETLNQAGLLPSGWISFDPGRGLCVPAAAFGFDDPLMFRVDIQSLEAELYSTNTGTPAGLPRIKFLDVTERSSFFWNDYKAFKLSLH